MLEPPSPGNDAIDLSSIPDSEPSIRLSLETALPRKCPGSDEQELLRLIADGDASAFWAMWTRFDRELFRTCLRCLDGNHDDAEDTLSAARLKACSVLPSRAQGILDIRAWLNRLVRNQCLDFRRHRSCPGCQVVYAEDPNAEGEPGTPPWVDGPEALLLDRERVERIRSAVAGLPRAFREPMILHAYEEMGYEEVAARLQLTEGNVRKRIQRGRTLLKQCLNHESVEGGAAPSGSVAAKGVVRPKPPRGEAPADRDEEEMTTRAASTRMIVVTLPSGAELSVHLVLNEVPPSPVRLMALQRYVATYPRGWKKRLELADLLYSIGRWEEAVGEYLGCLERQPYRVTLWLRLGEILRHINRKAEAWTAYERVMALAQGEATRRHAAGLMDLCRGRVEAASCAFESAARIEPLNGVHSQALGLAYLSIGWLEKAHIAFEAALQSNPDDLVSLLGNTDLLMAFARPLEAEVSLARALHRFPDCVPALARLAMQRLIGGMVRGAAGVETRRLIRTAVRLAPGDADTCDLKARYHDGRGEAAQSVRMLQAFCDEHPGSARGWFLLAERLSGSGDIDGTREAALCVRSLSPAGNDTEPQSEHAITQAGIRKP